MLNNSFYRVTITAAGLGGAAPGDGFIDPLTTARYSATNGGHVPASIESSTAKARGNMRFRAIIDAVQSMGVGYVSNVASTGATIDDPGTEIAFTVSFDRDEYVFTPDEAHPGQVLTGADAVRRCVARALMTDRTLLRDVYNPATSPGNSNNTTFIRNPSTTTTVTAGRLANDLGAAEGAVAVELMQGTNLSL